MPSFLDGDTWSGRHAEDFGGGVKREDFVLIGGICGRRRSRMRAQQGGARIYIFIESESFFTNGQSLFRYCSVLEKACWVKDLKMQYTLLLIFRNTSCKRTTTVMKNFGGPKYFLESKNCPNFKSCIGNEPPRSIFLPWLLHMYIDSETNFGPKCQCYFFHVGSVIEGHL